MFNSYSPAAGNLIRREFRWNGRIAGGRNGSIEDLPYQVSMQYFGSHRCGGSIVSHSLIVTAAHCVRGSIRRYTTVRAGSTYHDDGGVVVSVTRALEHENYNVLTNNNFDIGLLFLSSALVYGVSIQPILLPTRYLGTPIDVNATISGWGALEWGGQILPRILQVVEVPTVDQEVCAAAYAAESPTARVKDNMLCAGILETGGVDACPGDSGGPLVIDGVLHGIVSWGFGCGFPGFPGVYGRISHFIDWIEARRE